jgi:Ca2+-binding RTX toxin-like protein
MALRLLDEDLAASFERHSDGIGLPSVAVPPPGRPPAGIVLTGHMVAENAAPGTIIGALSAMDPDAGDTFTYILGGPSAGLFEIRGGLLTVARGAALDHETARSHALVVTAIDSHGLTCATAFTVSVRDLWGATMNGTWRADNLRGTSEEDVIRAGAGNDVLRGLAGDDRLHGRAGNDSLIGGLGADSLHGGEGDDIYQVDNVRDRVVEGRHQGIDTVRSSVSHKLGAHVETLVLAGSANLAGTGNDLDNSIAGNGGRNILKGGAGNDILRGMDGDDRLFGGAGEDWLAGGAGRDAFVFEKGHGRDHVADFRNGQDRIDVSRLSGVDGMSDLALIQVGRDVEIRHGASVLVLKDVAKASLDDWDFIF